MIRDMHHKIASWMETNYHEVLLPSLQTSEMARESRQSVAPDATDALQHACSKRKLSSSTVRAMVALSHHKFKTLLKHKMERAGGRLHECGEEHTSKTCSRCGNAKHDLGASETYSCTACHFTNDRDINAAKNIFHK